MPAYSTSTSTTDAGCSVRQRTDAACSSSASTARLRRNRVVRARHAARSGAHFHRKRPSGPDGQARLSGIGTGPISSSTRPMPVARISFRSQQEPRSTSRSSPTSSPTTLQRGDPCNGNDHDAGVCPGPQPGVTPADNVRVMLLLANASAGLPNLPFGSRRTSRTARPSTRRTGRQWALRP